MQTFSDNESLGVSTEKLNQYYLDGYTFKYPIPEEVNVFQVYPGSPHYVRRMEVRRF